MSGFLRSFVFAGRGLAGGLRGQRNATVMIVLAAAALALGWIYGISTVEWAVLALAVGLVLALELVNTALEELIDLVCPDYDPDFGRIKDILAGAVLLASLAAAAAGLLIFLPRILGRG